MGFAIPRAEWLRGPLFEISQDLLLDQTARNRNWFDTRFSAEILKRHKDGVDLDHILWPMLMIELWARNWVDIK